jgi:tetratricopeptide (TPR) repeat protein
MTEKKMEENLNEILGKLGPKARKNAYLKLAEKVEELGQFERASELGERELMSLNLKEKSGYYEEVFFKEGFFEVVNEVAKFAEAAGQFERASELYEERGHLHDAARTAKAAGLTERANEFYEKEINNLLEKASRSYFDRHYFIEAAKVAGEIGQFERALEICENDKKVNSPRNIYNYHPLITFYEKIGQFERALEICEIAFEDIKEIPIGPTWRVTDVNQVAKKLREYFFKAEEISKEGDLSERLIEIFEKQNDKDYCFKKGFSWYKSAAKVAR